MEKKFSKIRTRKLLAFILAVLLAVLQIPYNSLMSVRADGTKQTINLTVKSKTKLPETEGVVTVQAKLYGTDQANPVTSTMTLSAKAGVKNIYEYTGKAEFTYNTGSFTPIYATFSIDGKDYYLECSQLKVDGTLSTELNLKEYIPVKIEIPGNLGTASMTVNGSKIPLAMESEIYLPASSPISVTAQEHYYISDINSSFDGVHENYTSNYETTLPRSASEPIEYQFTMKKITIETDNSNVKLEYSMTKDGTYLPIPEDVPEGEFYLKMTAPDDKKFKDTDGVKVSEIAGGMAVSDESYENYNTVYKAKIKAGSYNYFHVQLEDKCCSITFVLNENGSITASLETDISNPQTIKTPTGTISCVKGTDLSLKVEPSDYYEVDSIEINGRERKSSFTAEGTNGTGSSCYIYKMQDLYENQNVKVNFVYQKKNVTFTKEGKGSIEPNLNVFKPENWEMTNGSVECKPVTVKGERNVVKLADINADSGYMIDSVKVNGNEVQRLELSEVESEEQLKKDYSFQLNEDGSWTLYLDVNQVTMQEFKIDVTFAKLEYDDEIIKINLNSDKNKTGGGISITDPVNKESCYENGNFIYKKGTVVWLSRNDCCNWIIVNETNWLRAYLPFFHDQDITLKSIHDHTKSDVSYTNDEFKPIHIGFDETEPIIRKLKVTDSSHDVSKIDDQTYYCSSGSKPVITFQSEDQGENQTGIDKVYYGTGDKLTKLEDIQKLKECTLSSGSYQIDVPELTAQTQYHIYAVDRAENIAEHTVSLKMDNDVPEIMMNSTVTGITSYGVELKQDNTALMNQESAVRKSTLNLFTFGSFFSNKIDQKVTVIAKAKDSSSGVKSITLFDKESGGNQISGTGSTMTEIKGIYQQIFEINSTSFQGAIYAEVVDQVGHSKRYKIDKKNSNLQSEEPVMIEQNAPEIGDIEVIEDNSTVSAKKYELDGKDIYANDVAFAITIKDPESGINTVKVEVNPDDSENKVEKVYTLAETKDTKTNTKKQAEFNLNQAAGNAIRTADYKPSQDGSYTVKITVIDNAGNISSSKKTIYIDDTTPVLREGADAVIFYQNNDRVKAFEDFGKVVLNIFSFGTFFANQGEQKAEITIHATDRSKTGESYNSGLANISLYSSKTGVDKVGEMEGSITSSDGEDTAKLKLTDNKYQGPLYVELEDRTERKARYLVTTTNSNLKNSSIMIDQKEPEIADITVTKEDGVKVSDQYYSGDVTFGVQISDADSGINAVAIEVNGTTKVYSYAKDEDYETNKQAQKNVSFTLPTREGAHAFDYQSNEDGTWNVKATAIDNAGNVCESKTVEAIIDQTAPEITAFTIADGQEGETTASDGIGNKVEMTQYGYYFMESVNVRVTAEDKKTVGQGVSGVNSITAYLRDYSNGKVYAVLPEGKTQPITEDQIAKIAPVAVSDNNISIKVPEEFKGQIFAYATDNVNNQGKIASPDGTIIESPKLHAEQEHVSLSKNETTQTDNAGMQLYSSDVNVNAAVMDTYSGIASVEWKVIAPYDTDKNVSGAMVIDNQGTLTGDTSGWSIAGTDKNLVTRLNSTITVSHNSNDISIWLKMTDCAGNTSEQTMTFSIDKSMPAISISYDNNIPDASHDTYYTAPRTATVTITERNFSEDRVDTKISNTLSEVPSVSSWSHAYSDNPDQNTHTATIYFADDGDYTCDMSYTDNAGNGPVAIATQQFTIDRTVPQISLSFDNNNSQNGNFYQNTRTATIQVQEHNFDAGRILIHGSADEVLNPGGWSDDGDSHTAQISFGTDGEYAISVAGSDMAGNQGESIPEQNFIIDLIDPELTITGVEDQVAYNDVIAPAISCNDTNLDLSGFQITLTKDGEKVNYDRSVSEEGRSYQFSDFAHEDKVDGIYELTATTSDMSGRVVEQTVTFSVNRFGSSYTIPDDVKNMIGKYVTDVKDLVITETNVDELSMDSIKVVLTRNGIPQTLIENTDYTITKSGGNGKWCVYTYTISHKLFDSDGSYSIAIYSRDKASNQNQNTMESKRAEVAFGVDKTAPVISTLDCESNHQYPVDSKNVTASISDNLVLGDVKIAIDGQPVTYEQDGDEYRFVVHSSSQKQNVMMSAYDAAGNHTDQELNNLLVTSNLWVRYTNSRTAIIVTIAIAAGLIVVIAGVIIMVNKKKNKQQVNN